MNKLILIISLDIFDLYADFIILMLRECVRTLNHLETVAKSTTKKNLLVNLIMYVRFHC